MSAGKNLAILATGSPDGGGSGARELMSHESIADRVAAIVTNYPNGGVAKLALEYPDMQYLSQRFLHEPHPQAT